MSHHQQHHLLLAIVIILLSSSTFASVGLAGSWPKWNFSPANLGYNKLVDGPDINTGSCSWQYLANTISGTQSTPSSPVFGSHPATLTTLYVVLQQSIHAINTTSKAKRWQVDTLKLDSSPIKSQLLTLTDGSIWTGGDTGIMRIVDTGSNNQPTTTWFPVASPHLGGPAVSADGSLVYFGTQDGELRAYDATANDIAPVWKFFAYQNLTLLAEKLGPSVTVNLPVPLRSATPDDDLIHLEDVPAMSYDGTIWIAFLNIIVGLHPRTGAMSQLYSVDLDASLSFHGGIAIDSNGFLYVSANSKTTEDKSAIVKVNCNTGKTEWNTATPAVIGQPSMNPDETVVIASCSDEFIYFLDANDGSMKKRYDVNEPTFSAATVDKSGTAYVVTTGGYVFGINSNTYVREMYLRSSGLSLISSPALGSDGTLYVVGHNTVLAYKRGACRKDANDSHGALWYFSVIGLPILGLFAVLFIVILSIYFVRRLKRRREYNSIQTDSVYDDDDA